MGLRIHVERGALVVEDGMGEHRRTRRFDKATHGLSRLVVIGSSGYLTLDALTWCRRLGIGILVLAPDGAASLASTPRMTDDARLRRQQAMAPHLPVGLDLARYMIGRKLAGQADVLRSHFGNEESAPLIAMLVAELDEAADVEAVRSIEALGAETYWRTWSGQTQTVPRFAAKDRRRAPAHWTTSFEGRRSVLRSANGNRRAERPVNGLLNFTYALLEAEAVIACAAVGLDPGFGIVHLDTPGRQSLALDLMEPVRPFVDAFVLDLLERRTFRKVDFMETADGHCRLRAPLTHELAESIPHWSRAVGPYAEHVAHAVGQVMAGKYNSPTPLTRRRNQDAQASIKARKSAGSTRAKASTDRQRPSTRTRKVWSCPDCGAPVANHRHVRCASCIAADPRQTPTLRATRAAAISSRRQAETAWMEASGGASSDPEDFAATVIPALRSVKLSTVVNACGVSKSTASSWRTGKTRPHPSHWVAAKTFLRHGFTRELPLPLGASRSPMGRRYESTVGDCGAVIWDRSTWSDPEVEAIRQAVLRAATDATVLPALGVGASMSPGSRQLSGVEPGGVETNRAWAWTTQ